MRITDKYVLFWKQTCFSQWYPSNFTVDGVEYNCCEQYMMAEKARLFGDSEMEAKIMKANHPRQQKAYGREVKNFDKAKWDAVAKDIVYRANFAKFSQHPSFKKELMETGDLTLVEASGFDQIWGIGLFEEDDRCLDQSTWLGLNWLGEVLTKLRDDFKNETIN